MKTIDTLVDDIAEVVKGNGGWDNTITHFLSESIAEVAKARFSAKQQPRGYLSLSSIGTPCKRKLWYKVNKVDEAEALPYNAYLKFFFGDIIEALVLSLAKAAGHSVEGMQDRLNVEGIIGHRDAIIDGVTIDVKSASPAAFKKFKTGNLRNDDAFGYISQLSSYVYAGKDDPLVVDKTRGGFLVIDKVNGHICLDLHDFTTELALKKQEMDQAREMVSGDLPDERIPPVQQSKTSPNTKLAVACSYCEFKKVCYPEARCFLYESGPVWLVDVVNEPRVFEVKDADSEEF